MKIGVVYPQTEIEPDAGAQKEYAQAVERMGYAHVLAYDHIVGANTASRPDWKGPYRLESQFHEPFTLFSYMAGVTSQLGFVTGIIILPQRQTVLAAKQAACLDQLCSGRLRLGIGLGWNEVEYEALGMNFHDRGKRVEEQVEVMRALWTKPAVTFNTKYHRITDAGLNPLPVQRPIPVWFGGGGVSRVLGTQAPASVLKRIARLGDGWLPMMEPDASGKEALVRMRGLVQEAGRDPQAFGVDGRLSLTRVDESKWLDSLGAWRSMGISHLSVNTMGDGLKGAQQHLKRLEAFAKAANISAS